MSKLENKAFAEADRLTKETGVKHVVNVNVWAKGSAKYRVAPETEIQTEAGSLTEHFKSYDLKADYIARGKIRAHR